MSKHGRFEKRKPPKKGRKVLLIVLCVVLILLACAAAAVVMLYKNMVGKINYVGVEDKEYTMTDDIIAMMGNNPTTEATEATSEPTTVPVTETTAPTEPPYKEPDILNILVSGNSARGDEAPLADTLMLVTINKDTKVLTLTSFLRDTYVDLPDYKGHTCGWNRINVNYALGYLWAGTGGAMEMTNLCIKKNFGIEVDYNIEVGFEAFEKVIDVLGGVRIDLTKEEADYINNMHKDWLQVVTPGENRLFGETALEYARMRKAEGDSDSDIKRTARQRKLLTALFAKIGSKGVSAIQDLANEVLPLVSTNMTQAQITECLFDVLPLLPGMTLEQGTCPVEGTYWGEDKELPDGWANVLVFERPQQMNLMMPITEGKKP